MIGDDKEVYFDQYCKDCKHYKDSETDVNSPCYDCIEVYSRQDSHMPMNFKKKETRKKPSL